MITKVRCYFTDQLVPTAEAIRVILREHGGHYAIQVFASPHWMPRIPFSWIGVEGDAVVITL